MRWLEERALRRSVRSIGEFWTWWATVRDSLTAAVERGELEQFARMVGERVERIDDELGWHTEPPVAARHRLVVSGSSPALRAAAERWRRAAPRDGVWEFASRRRAAEDPAGTVLQAEGVRIPLDEARFLVEQRGDVLDVVLVHPALGALQGRQRRVAVAITLLDLVVGEDEVERRIGGIEAADRSEREGIGAAALRDAVERLGADDTWRLVDVTYRDGSSAVMQVGPRLSPLDHLPFDRHALIRLPYRARPDGLADGDELGRVHAAQQRIVAALGGLGVLVATEMHRGRRTLHVFTDAADRNAQDVLERAVRAERATVRHRLDPSWHAIRHLRALRAPRDG